ncbi:homeobox-leucine zipper protein ROC5-like [Bidens hawaiensis]|uniref:homeobox-leucine zipper protein ROC5-like n=1 Tax=Bidens hawaiensis TaxID=980011 RepID=UPI00404A5E3B
MANAPLWNSTEQGAAENLNFVEYARTFHPCLGTRPQGFVPEATRASCVIPMTSITLVKALLDADQYRDMFPSMIGDCSTMEVFSNGIGGSKNGAIQLVTWIEHTEYPDRSIHDKYVQLIRSSVAFGAQRWINALLHHCACLRALTLDNNNVFVSTRRCLKGLEQRMTRRLCDAICLTDGHYWRLVAVAPGTSKIMARNSIDVREPAGAVLSIHSRYYKRP